MTKVFVYGTLKSNYYGKSIFSKNQFISIGATVPIMNLAHRGFPVATFAEKYPDKPAGKIVGEIYEVDERQLDGLDQYEGYPTFYSRQEITVTDEGDQPHECLIYIGEGAASPDLPFVEPNETGFIIWNRG